MLARWNGCRVALTDEPWLVYTPSGRTPLRPSRLEGGPAGNLPPVDEATLASATVESPDAVEASDVALEVNFDYGGVCGVSVHHAFPTDSPAPRGDGQRLRVSSGATAQRCHRPRTFLEAYEAFVSVADNLEFMFGCRAGHAPLKQTCLTCTNTLGSIGRPPSLGQAPLKPVAGAATKTFLYVLPQRQRRPLKQVS